MAGEIAVRHRKQLSLGSDGHGLIINKLNRHAIG
jgi:hypothetical protein